MPSIALSIDLDYFNELPATTEENMDLVLEQVVKAKVPVFLCDDHQYIADFFNRFEFSTLINMDMHSDLKEVGEIDRNEGNWVNFVPSKGRKFIWLVSDIRFTRDTHWGRVGPGFAKNGLGNGRTDTTPGFFTEKMAHLRPWKNVKVTTAKSVIAWSHVACVGIALSSFYTDNTIRHRFDSIWRDLFLGLEIELGPDCKHLKKLEKTPHALHSPSTENAGGLC
jgi:hypothetical protein